MIMTLEKYIGNNQVSGGRWVRSSERLPRLSGIHMVIITRRDKYMMSSYRWTGSKWQNFGGGKTPDVVVWLEVDK